MGIGTTLELLTSAQRLADSNRSGRGTGVISPWQEGSLSPILYSDLFGIATQPVTKHEALRVPAVAKGRALLHSIITPRPLVALRGPERLVGGEEPTWLYRSDTGIATQMRTGLILDDLLFHEASLLVVARGSVGQITDAVHCPYDRWHLDADGVVWVRAGDDPDLPMQPDEVVYIPGPGPGLLAMAGETIRAAREMDKAWIKRVRNPMPMISLHEREDNGMTPEEATAYVAAVNAARADPDNATAFIPYTIELQTHAAEQTDLFESGRNALRLDIANFMNLPAALLDGSVSEASLTYSTQEGRRNELFDYGIQYWAGPIEQALSLDNVVPRGTRIRFDWTDLDTTTAAPTGAITED